MDSGERARNTFLTCPEVRDSPRKPGIIPDDPAMTYVTAGKDLLPRDQETSYQLVGEVKAHQG